jgi:heme/copper-type cytochrome/quinol oxidase subunit 3
MTEVVLTPGPLPVGPHDKKSSTWWGVLCLIATEAALFSYLEFSYYYFDVQLPHSWRPEPPKLHYALPDTIVLLASSVFVWIAERAIKRGERGKAMINLMIGFVLGVIFVGVQGLEWSEKTFRPQTGPYGSLYFTTTGFHMVHVIAGLGGLFFIMLWLGMGLIDSRRNAALSNVAIYWHFVDAVWVTLFFMFYISPHLW